MIVYNVPFEVSRNQYAALINRLGGVVAHRYDPETGKFFVKVWVMKYVSNVKQILNSIK